MRISTDRHACGDRDQGFALRRRRARLFLRGRAGVGIVPDAGVQHPADDGDVACGVDGRRPVEQIGRGDGGAGAVADLAIGHRAGKLDVRGERIAAGIHKLV